MTADWNIEIPPIKELINISNLEIIPYTLEDKDVVALFSKDSRSDKVTGTAMSVKISTAFSAAF